MLEYLLIFSLNMKSLFFMAIKAYDKSAGGTKEREKKRVFK